MCDPSRVLLLKVVLLTTLRAPLYRIVLAQINTHHMTDFSAGADCDILRRGSLIVVIRIIFTRLGIILLLGLLLFDSEETFWADIFATGSR